MHAEQEPVDAAAIEGGVEFDKTSQKAKKKFELASPAETLQPTVVAQAAMIAQNSILSSPTAMVAQSTTITQPSVMTQPIQSTVVSPTGVMAEPTPATQPDTEQEDPEKRGRRLFSETRRLLQINSEHAMTLAELVDKFKENEEPSQLSMEQLYQLLSRFNVTETGFGGAKPSKGLQVHLHGCI